jgi:Tfp pilus assembly protein FimT
MHAWTRPARGVTLLELCFGLGLMALVAGLAAPGFRATLRVTAVRAATFELMAGLQQTRANSIVESRPGSFCPGDASGCLPASVPGTSWRAQLDGSPDAAIVRLLPRGVRVLATRSPIRFWPTAHAASAGTLTICDTQGIAPPRAIVVSATGRARLADAPDDACA